MIKKDGVAGLVIGLGVGWSLLGFDDTDGAVAGQMVGTVCNSWSGTGWGPDPVFFEKQGSIEVVQAVEAGSGTFTAEVGLGFGFGQELFAGRRGTKI
jgi:hypothetical protein